MDPLQWFYKVFDDILKYFKTKYNPNDNDLVGMTIRNQDFRDAYVSMKKSSELSVDTIIKALSNVTQSNKDFNIRVLTVCYKHIKMPQS